MAELAPAGSGPDGTPPGELGPDNEAQLARLRRALSMAMGFQLVLLEIPEHPIRRVVLDRVLAWSAAGEIPPLRHLVIDPAAPEEMQIADRIVAASTGCIVDGLDSVFVSNAVFERALGTLNWYRERLRELEGPLVLVLSPRGTSALMARAPDFATWRSHSCRIAAPRSEAVSVPFGALLDPQPDPLELDVTEAALVAARHKGLSRDKLAILWLAVARARARASDGAGHDDAIAAAEELISSGIDDPGVAADLATTMIFDDIQQGRLDKARDRLAAFDDSSEAELPASIKASLTLYRAQLALAAQSWLEATEHARVAVQRADEADAHLLRLEARYALIVSVWRLGDLSSARSVAEEVVAISTEITEVARALCTQADIDVARGRLDLAVDTLMRALWRVGAGPDHAAERSDITVRLTRIAAQAMAATRVASSHELVASAANLFFEAAALAQSDGDPRRYEDFIQRQLKELAQRLDRSSGEDPASGSST